MKKTILLSALLFSMVGIGQTYVLDSTFGSAGKLVDVNSNFMPVNIYFENNQYFLVNWSNSMVSLNYDGSRNTNFGNNGSIFFNTASDRVYRVVGSKYHNGYFYVYGQVTFTSSSITYDLFIAKISTSGVLDPSFGVNGILKTDFGEAESLNDILFLNDGKIIGIGDKNNVAGSPTSLIAVKINGNGSLDTAFDASGYKTFTVAQGDSTGSNLFSYGNGILLVGQGYYDGGWKLRLIKIDADGNYDTSFGTNGFKHKMVPSTVGTGSVYDAKLVGNELYFQSRWSFSFQTQGKNLKKYSINTDVMTDLGGMLWGQSYYSLDANGKIYSTGFQRCSNTTASNCSRDFEFRRRNADGTIDTTFHIDGRYTYNFLPATLYSDDRSTVYYLHNDGKIFLAGIGYNPFPADDGTGLAMIRLVEGPLSIEENQNNKPMIANPVGNELLIEKLEGKTINRIAVYDLLGKQVLSSREDVRKIDVSFLKAGIYIVQVIADGIDYSVKMIKK